MGTPASSVSTPYQGVRLEEFLKFYNGQPDNDTASCMKVAWGFIQHVAGPYMSSTVLEITTRQDLLQAGWLGLCEAAQEYDTERGTRFGTYAFLRVQRAVVDQIRERDHLSRGQRKKAQQGTFHCEIVPLFGNDAVTGPVDWLRTKNEQTPRDVAADEEEIERILFCGNPVIEAYAEGRTLFEVGELFGFSESRACQLVQHGVQELREKYNPDALSDDGATSTRSQSTASRRTTRLS